MHKAMIHTIHLAIDAMRYSFECARVTTIYLPMARRRYIEDLLSEMFRHEVRGSLISHL